MAKSIAFISGKGGSGKTTLALSISSMFADAGINVLYVDCDMATNGATYFYENKLENGKKIYTLYDILHSDDVSYDFIKISKNLSFIPSISNIQNYKEDKNLHQNDINTMKEHFSKFYESMQYMYDIIFFDCQAGYSLELESLLPHSDFNLAVMEADAVSSAAMRSLYLKIGHIIRERRLFQTFNKLSSDEYPIYSKVSGGTVFTNIEAVLFDWSIKKAFAVSQVPNLTDTSIKYVEQILNICKIIFNTIIDSRKLEEKFSNYEKGLTLQKLEKRKKELYANVIKLKKNKKNSNLYFRAMILIIPLILSTICVSLYSFIDTSSTWGIIVSAILIALTCCFSIAGGISAMAKPYRKTVKYVKSIEDEIYDINSKIESLEESLNGSMEDNSKEKKSQ